MKYKLFLKDTHVVHFSVYIQLPRSVDKVLQRNCRGAKCLNISTIKYAPCLPRVPIDGRLFITKNYY